MDRTDVPNDRVAALVATSLLRAAPEAIDETITNAFADVGLHRGVDRAYYYRLDESEAALELTHEWHAPGLRPMLAVPALVRLPLDVLPDHFLASLRRGGVLRLPRTLGVLGDRLEGIVAPDGDRAVAVVPVALGGVLIGVAGFAAACESVWSEGDVDLLEVVAQGVARAVERRRVDEALRLSEARFRAMCDRISDAFVALDSDGRFRYVNEPALVMLGRARADLIGKVPWVVNPDLSGGPFHRAYVQAIEDQRAVTFEAPGPEGNRWYEVRVYPSATGVSVFAKDISDRKRHEEQLASDREYLRQEVGGLGSSSDIVGLGAGLRQVIERVSLVAAGNTTVLITGETGTGKELVARALHERSPRRERLLVTLNCAAISTGLVESELFGHEKGAFTGALQRRKGRFELAHGGTLFLDEVGELPLDLQAKLLRVLQERAFERVGGSETVRVDVRVVAATNRNLADMVARGQFREDLYYRLNVFPVALPPLRERTRDVPILVHSFLRRFARQAGKRITEVAPEAMRRLEAYHWPGNVRELQNVIERAVILATGPRLDAGALPELAPAPPVQVSVSAPMSVAEAPIDEAHTVEQVQRDHVTRTLADTGWVIDGQRGAARRLGLHPNTLRSRLKRWGLKRPGVPLRAAS